MKRCIGKGETHEGGASVFPASYFEDEACFFGGDGADSLEGVALTNFAVTGRYQWVP